MNELAFACHKKGSQVHVTSHMPLLKSAGELTSRSRTTVRKQQRISDETKHNGQKFDVTEIISSLIVEDSTNNTPRW